MSEESESSPFRAKSTIRKSTSTTVCLLLFVNSLLRIRAIDGMLLRSSLSLGNSELSTLITSLSRVVHLENVLGQVRNLSSQSK